MTEILHAGAWVSSNYTPEEMREALWKAFVRDKMDSITLRNSKSESQFLAASASYGVQRGWLEATHVDFGDEQDAGDTRLWLTEAGRAEFGVGLTEFRY